MKERTECRWWQRHQWGRWIEIEKIYHIISVGFDTKEYWQRRTCKVCGKIKERKVV